MATSPSVSARWRRLGTLLIWVGRRFYTDQCLTRASALAYTSLLSIVPLLAVMFAVLKGLGVQHRLEPLLLSRLALNEETTHLVIGYIDNTNVGTLGVLGAVFLVFTVISVLGTIESSLDHVWRVSTPRSTWRQITDYLSIVLLTPFLLLAGVAITSIGQVQVVLSWILERGYIGGIALQVLRLSPILLNTVAIGALYAIMPNRRPAWRPVLISAVLVGASWYLVQLAFVSLQIGVARNDAIYGALAQLPVTLMWLYVSWVVVLLGAELAAVLEFGPRSVEAGPVDREAVALHVLVRVADAFERGARVPVVELARELDLGVDLVDDVAADLRQRGWVTATDVAPPELTLGRSSATITLGPLHRVAAPLYVPQACDPRARAALEALRADCQAAADRYTLAEIVRRNGEQGAVGRAAGTPARPRTGAGRQ